MLTRACTLLATEEDMCCSDPSECPPGVSAAPGTPPASFAAWIAEPNVQGDYSDGEFTWLVAARSALVDAHDEVAANVCGVPLGVCQTTLRPCLPCNCRTCLLCGAVTELDIGEVIAGEILNVVLDRWDTSNDIAAPDDSWVLGTELRVEGGSRLVVQGCPDEPADLHCWPTQDRSRPIGCASTWRLVVTHGAPLNNYDTLDGRFVFGAPGYLRAAIGDLACIKLNRCLPADKCHTPLPDNTESVTAAGQTVRLITALDYAEKGLTGVKSVDLLRSLIVCDDVSRLDDSVPVYAAADPTGQGASTLSPVSVCGGAEFIIVSTEPADDPSTTAVEVS